MNIEDYVELTKEIQKNNSLTSENNLRKIKYITLNYDTRDNSIYNIKFREWFKKDYKTFIGHECALKNILNWLGSEQR